MGPLNHTIPGAGPLPFNFRYYAAVERMGRLLAEEFETFRAKHGRSMNDEEFEKVVLTDTGLTQADLRTALDKAVKNNVIPEAQQTWGPGHWKNSFLVEGLTFDEAQRIGWAAEHFHGWFPAYGRKADGTYSVASKGYRG